MKKITVGILAHVDAGKTTLSESLLYLSGSIRTLGRVDYQNAFLDTHELEQTRGITIFSKQAVFLLNDQEITLLDTPGHVDFSAEMERTLSVLDYAILVINGASGIQGHTETLWRLLASYHIPVFLFVNKMDQAGTDQQALLIEIKKFLNDNCVDFSVEKEVYMENIAMCDETVLEQFLEHGDIKKEEIVRLIAQRKLFPCYFGSALKLEGVKEFIQGLGTYIRCPKYPETFGAKIYKISRDEQGNRLTHLKITGGKLKVKEMLTNRKEDSALYGPSGIWEEKVNQIRIYSGAKYQTVNEACAGTVCAVTGLNKTVPGEGLGIESPSKEPVLAPVLTYQVQLPPECDAFVMLQKLRLLEEEEPLLHILWNETLNEIHVQMMGEIQTEILKSMILDRFDVSVEFSSGNIVYKETILEPIEGAGHFEPLRHYAEVHLLLEPLQRGKGLLFATSCSEDLLEGNWQRLILTHLAEKEHKGVLTGSAITDMKITLTAGRAHQKHTEGGDFREATYRAVRQGLMKAKSVLLEPYYDFRIDVPSEMIGRAMSDIQKMHGVFQTPEMETERCILSGYAPVIHLQNYQKELQAYSGGRGKLVCTVRGYEVCHNEDEVIQECGYEAERDTGNTANSVFCSHGSGYVVSWDQADQQMHLGKKTDREQEQPITEHHVKKDGSRSSDFWNGEKELEEIFKRTYGEKKKETYSPPVRVRAESQEIRKSSPKKKMAEQYLLVDGYNIIFAWEDLKVLAEENIDAARDRLMEILCNYQGFKKCTLILVFDAYRVEGHVETTFMHNNIHVVYTKEAETADQYIEKTVHRIGRTYDVTVATSDRLEQVIILGQGGNLLSAQGLKEEVGLVEQQIREVVLARKEKGRNYLFDHMSDEMAEYMEEVRLGKKEPPK